MDLLQPTVEERLKHYNNNPDNELLGLPVCFATLTIVFELMSSF